MKEEKAEVRGCAHYASSYLPLTENWIYRAIVNHKGYSPLFLSRKKQNLVHFPIQKLYSLEDLTRLRRYVEILFFKLSGYFLFFKKTCEANNVKILHIHFGYHGVKSIGLKSVLKIPMVCSFYGDDAFAKTYENTYAALFKSADTILVLGPYMRSRLISLGCPEEKLVIHHLGIDIDEIKFVQRKYKEGDTLRFLIASSFLEKKGIDIAIKALVKFKNDFDFRLDIIGDGPLKAEIVNEIKKGGIADRVTLHGYRPYAEVIRLAYECHVLIQASRTTKDNRKEGTPMVIVDAMATGMGVISTNHSDIPEIVREGENGYLAEENSVESLQACLRKIFEDPNKIETLGINARRWIETEFNVKLQAIKLEKIYSTLIAKHTG